MEIKKFLKLIRLKNNFERQELDFYLLFSISPRLLFFLLSRFENARRQICDAEGDAGARAETR